MRARLASAGLLLALAACTPQMTRLTLQPDRLVGPTSGGALRCPYRLADVLDERAGKSNAGGLGLMQLQLDDVTGVVRANLLQAGLAPPGVGDGRDVVVHVRQAYLAQTNSATSPSIVYQVEIAGQAPFVIRYNETSVPWSASEKAVHAILAKAFHGADRQLLDALSARCGP